MDWYGKVLVGDAQTRYPQTHIFRQGHATIRFVWRSLHTGGGPAIRTQKQPRDQRPGAVFLLAFGLTKSYMSIL